MSKAPQRKVKQTKFPASLFFVLFGSLLLMSGVHMGFIVLVNRLELNKIIQTAVPILYWALMALGLTVYTKWRMKKTYDEPMQILAAATARVAKGDFSVYVPPYHTVEELDYFDVMLGDFNKMVEELGSIETLKTDFFSNVSHEIKTPIAVIQNNAELLQRENLQEDDRRECTRSIMQATRRLSGLISNMLKLNKLEKQAIQPLPEEYDLCGQLAQCALSFEERWEQKGIEFEADMEDSALIYADGELMELVWNNLFSNAVKFTEAGGRITLRESSDEKTVTVSVADTGCGMSEETAAHIFDKFYQGDTSHSTEGNGLGLSLALRVLELSGAGIEVKSAPGRGSVFTVAVPKKTGGDAADERN